jgi:DNA-binding SARP family transcriptional activator/tetratricopeptide (TPR) repeat protein
MAMGTQFRLLGDLEASVDGRLLELGHLRQSCVLAVLLLDANRAVPVDELMDRVWGERPPQRARETLYGYLSRLRSALAPATDVQIARRPAGYLLTVDPDAVDVHRFRRLVLAARGATARGAPDDQALDMLEQALRLWRGEPMAALDTPWLAGMRAALDRARLGAELDRNDLALRDPGHAPGRHARLLDQIAAAATAYPLDERLAGQLMLALYRSGRAGEALDRYQLVRGRLADELGIDPGEPLRRLYQRILRADPTLVPSVRAAATPSTVDKPGPVPAARQVPAPRPVPAPRQVPAPPPTFAGRVAELGELTRLVEAAAICAIVGPGGIGKTWIAQRWADQHRSRYPDGQLYVDLRGFDPAGPPVPPQVAVRGFLDALGVAPEAVPADLSGQTALYRSLVADRRLLIVLDNARDSAHAGPMLPGTASCAVLVTSRHQLVGLVTAHGARPLTLGLLADDQARAVLAGHLGDGRLSAEPAAVDALLRHCAGLPLALGIIAARAAVHPGLPLAALAAELDEAATRLDALDAGELAVNLRAVLACSTEALPPDARRLFALLGVLSGADAGLFAVASLAGTPVPATRVLLRQLAAAHLVTHGPPGRYRMHDLLRLYAAELAGQLDDRAAAHQRLLDHYLHTAYAADRLIDPFRAPIALPAAPAGISPALLGDHTQALAWFGTEHANLLAAFHEAEAAGRDEHVWRLAWAMATYLDRYAHWQDEASVYTAALTAALRLADHSAQAGARIGLARALIWLGRYEQARDHLHRALERNGDPGAAAYIHRRLARSHAREGRPDLALPHDQRALELYRVAGDRFGQGQALNAIGWHHAHLGEYQTGLRYCEQALALQREIGDQRETAFTLDSLAFIHRHLGRYDEAIACYLRAIDIYDQHADWYYRAASLAGFGDTYALAGDLDHARASWHRAAVAFEELGVPAVELRAKLAAPAPAPAAVRPAQPG